MRHIVRRSTAVWIAGDNWGPELSTAKKTILCVDDEQSLSIQKLTLETRGYRLLPCSTAMEAIGIVFPGGGTIDLVLCSVDLPSIRRLS